MASARLIPRRLAPLLLILIALAACPIPARRAARLDSIVVLREE